MFTYYSKRWWLRVSPASALYSHWLGIWWLWWLHRWGLDHRSVRTERIGAEAASTTAHTRHAASLGHLTVPLLYLLGLAPHVVQGLLLLSLVAYKYTNICSKAKESLGCYNKHITMVIKTNGSLGRPSQTQRVHRWRIVEYPIDIG